MSFKLHGSPQSTCTSGAALIAKERNIPYEFILVSFETGEHKQPAHLAHQPFGQVPYIVARRISSPPYCRAYAGSLTLPSPARVARRRL